MFSVVPAVTVQQKGLFTQFLLLCLHKTKYRAMKFIVAGIPISVRFEVLLPVVMKNSVF
jgi:hypothetical protein